MEYTGEPREVTDKSEDSRGRAIYFFHSHETKLPVRDVNSRHKKEPHIEYGLKNGLNQEYIVGAENFCNKCYPKAIQKVLENDEEYLFLVTFPKHDEIGPTENHIVGYIRNEYQEQIAEDHFAVVGETKLYSFADAIPASEFGKRSKGPLGVWGETYDEEQTKEIIDHFDGCADVTEQCLEKVLELEGEGNITTNTGKRC